MLYVGLLAVGASAWYFISVAVRAIRDKREEYIAICALLLHIRGALSSGGGTLCDITRNFKSEILEKNGVLGCLGIDSASLDGGNGEKMSTRAFFRDKLSGISFRIDKEDADKLLSYLVGFGKSYLEEEKRKLSEITDYFQARERSVSENSEKNIKAIWTVFAFCFVGAFILLL